MRFTSLYHVFFVVIVQITLTYSSSLVRLILVRRFVLYGFLNQFQPTPQDRLDSSDASDVSCHLYSKKLRRAEKKNEEIKIRDAHCKRRLDRAC